MEKLSNKVISARDLFPAIRETLSQGQKAKFTVSGNSMYPFITGNRDQVLLTKNNERLKVGDIILFQNKYGKYILHRIYKIEKEGYCTIGDACLFRDGIIPPSEVVGIVEKIYRKGKEIDCNAILWRAVFSVWLILLPFRKYLLCLASITSRIKGRLLTKAERRS